MKGRHPGSLLGSLCLLLRLVRVLPIVLDQADDVCQVQAAGEDIEQHFILLHALHELFQGKLACRSTLGKGPFSPAAFPLPLHPPRAYMDHNMGPFLMCQVRALHPKPHPS